MRKSHTCKIWSYMAVAQWCTMCVCVCLHDMHEITSWADSFGTLFSPLNLLTLPLAGSKTVSIINSAQTETLPSQTQKNCRSRTCPADQVRASKSHSSCWSCEIPDLADLAQVLERQDLAQGMRAHLQPIFQCSAFRNAAAKAPTSI